MTACKKRRGFSLIEAAIVLGVVGIVIGGIWYAATSVIQSQRINDTAAGILQIASGARRLFSHADYPTTASTDTTVTSTVVSAGLFPADFKIGSSGFAISPMGAMIRVHISTGPRLRIGISGLSTLSDCAQLIRRFAAPAKDNNDLLEVWGGSLRLTPPFNPALVTCPANTGEIVFWFRP